VSVRPVYSPQDGTEARELCIAERTTVVVAADHWQLMITDMDRRIPAVRVDLAEVVMVRLVAVQ
jgi:hypothetical protein